LLRNYAEKIPKGARRFTLLHEELLAAQLGNDADALDVVLEFMKEGWASNLSLAIGDRRKQLSEPHRWAASVGVD